MRSDQVTVKLPPDVRREAERMAADQGHTLSAWLRWVVTRAVQAAAGEPVR